MTRLQSGDQVWQATSLSSSQGLAKISTHSPSWPSWPRSCVAPQLSSSTKSGLLGTVMWYNIMQRVTINQSCSRWSPLVHLTILPGLPTQYSWLELSISYWLTYVHWWMNNSCSKGDPSLQAPHTRVTHFQLEPRPLLVAQLYLSLLLSLLLWWDQITWSTSPCETLQLE